MGATSFLGRDAGKLSFLHCILVQRGHPIIFVVVFSGLLFPFVLPCLSTCSLELLISFPPCSFRWAARAPSFSLRLFIFRCFLFSKGHKAFVFAPQLITRLAVLVHIRVIPRTTLYAAETLRPYLVFAPRHAR